MEFENMMFTPVIYQDIPSSFMMQPMAPMYGGMYPTYGVGKLQPAIPNDKFQKLEAKNQETKSAIKKTAIGLAILTAAGILMTKAFKPNIKLFPKTRAALSYGWNATKNALVNVWNKFTGIFKKNPTP